MINSRGEGYRKFVTAYGLPDHRLEDRAGYLQAIKEISHDQGIKGEILMTTRLEDLAMDSLDFIQLINGIDDEFSVQIPHAVAIKFQTVIDIVNWLEEKA